MSKIFPSYSLAYLPSTALSTGEPVSQKTVLPASIPDSFQKRAASPETRKLALHFGAHEKIKQLVITEAIKKWFPTQSVLPKYTVLKDAEKAILSARDGLSVAIFHS